MYIGSIVNGLDTCFGGYKLCYGKELASSRLGKAFELLSITCAGYLLIRPDLSDKRGLSCCFTLIISREQHNGQIPSLATIARQTLDKTRHFSLGRRHTFRFNAQSC